MTILPAGSVTSFSPRSDCEGTCGAPINLTNGNTWVEQQDYSLPGLGGGIELTRVWNSQWQSNNPPVTAGMFGLGWWSNLEQSLQVIDTNTIKYWQPDGAAWVMTFNSAANNYTVSSPPDERATLTFDSSTALYTLTLRNGNKRIFNNTGRLTKFRDRNGNQTALTYDASNRISQVTDAGGRSITFTYGNSQNTSLVTSVQDSTGNIATYTYLSNALSQVAYPDGGQLNFAYDASNRITSVTDDQGKVLESHTYDGSGRGLTSARANGIDAVTVAYPSQGTTTLTDSRSFVTTYGSTQIGGRGFINSISGSGCATCGGRGTHGYSYDSAGNRTSAQDELSHVVNFAYDSNGNVTSRSQLLNGQTISSSYTYNSFNQILTATDPLGNKTTSTYDANGNLLTTTTPAPDVNTQSSITTFTYDSKGELLTVEDPRHNVSTIAYTTAGLIDTVTDAQSKLTKYEYDARGNRTAATEDAGTGGLAIRTTFEYDSRKRLKKINHPTTPATSTQFAYDTRGRRTTATDANGKVTTYAYDDADRLTSLTDAQTPTHAVTQYAYDSENNLTSITDALNRVTTFTYDERGRVTQTTFPSTLTEGYTYDAAGNLVARTDRKGNTTTYTYDVLNRLTHKQYQDGSGVDFVYDNASRMTQASDGVVTGMYQFSYDNMDRLKQTTTTYTALPNTNFVVKYGYDAASNRTSMTDPQNGVTNYVYDTLNRLTSLTNPQSQQFTFTFNALGRRTKLTRPNAVNSTYSYDSLSRLLSVLHKLNTTTLDGATYTYDAVGNRTSKADNRTNTTDTYTYDALYQLLNDKIGTTSVEHYTYDLVGNRLSSATTTQYNYNNSNQLTSRSPQGTTWTYDNNGSRLTQVNSNETINYTWDFENRLTQQAPSGGVATSYKYDPFGRRISVSPAGATSVYVYDGANVLEQVRTDTGAVIVRYTEGPGIDEHLAQLRGSTTTYYEADGLGSITSLTNSSGAIVNTYTWDPYGKLKAWTAPVENLYGYTGRDTDGYYRARYYDAAMARFLSEDPIGFGAGGNFYRYVNNNPVLNTDPTGECIITLYFAPTGEHSDGFFYHSFLIVTDNVSRRTPPRVFRAGPNDNAPDGPFLESNFNSVNASRDNPSQAHYSMDLLHDQCPCTTYAQTLENFNAYLNAPPGIRYTGIRNSNTVTRIAIEKLGLRVPTPLDLPLGIALRIWGFGEELPLGNGGNAF